MQCKGVVNGDVVVLDPEAKLPNGATVEVRVVEPAAEVIDPTDVEARLRAALEWKARLSPEELAARVDATVGMLAGAPGSVEEFLREKHEDTEREERRWEERNR